MKVLLIFLIQLFLIYKVFCQPNLIEKEILTLIKYEGDIDISKSPGILIGIINKDKIFKISLGQFKDLELNCDIYNHCFEIGNLTNLFNILLVNNLEHLNIFDTPVQNILPQFQNTDIGNKLIKELLAHQTGLPKTFTHLNNLKNNRTDHFSDLKYKEIIEELQLFKGSKMDFIPSQYNSYLISKCLQTILPNYSALLESEGCFIEKCDNNFCTIKHYSKNLNSVNGKNFGDFQYSLGGRSTMNQMLTLSMKLLELSLGSTFQQNFLTLKSDKGDDFTLMSNGGFYYQIRKKSGTAFAFSGATEGSAAFLCFCPKTKTAVILLSNSGQSIPDLGIHILRTLNNNWKRNE